MEQKESKVDTVVGEDEKILVQPKDLDDPLYNLKVKQDAIRDRSTRSITIR
jgi:hypothetical protein